MAINRLLRWFPLLALGYLAVSLLVALKFLAPDPLTDSFGYPAAAALAGRLAQLALLTGLTGAAFWRAAVPLPRDLALVWLALIAAVIVGGWLGTADSVVFDLALAAPLLAALILLGGRLPLWSAGAAAALIALLLAVFRPVDPASDLALRAFSAGLLLHVAIPLMALAVADAGQNPTAWGLGGLLALSGALHTAVPLRLISGGAAIAATGAALLLPALSVIVLVLGLRAARTPGWTLALILGLIASLLGALGAAANAWTLGTRLSDLETLLRTLAGLAVLLDRLPRLRPAYWVVVTGVIAGCAGLAAAGVVQVFVERVLSIGYLDTQALIVPLYWGWIGGIAVIALGMAGYAVATLRQP